MTQTALITGASSGIGAELARIHAASKGNLVIVARRADRLQALKAELERAHGVAVTVIADDLTDGDAARRIHAAVQSAGIKVDFLINNAGFGGRGLFHEIPWTQSLSMIQLNAMALAGLTRAFLPDFVERNSGRILNVTSTAAEMPGPLQAVYFASKAFSASLSNALAEELRSTEVTITNFMPAATATEFAARAGMEGSALFANAVSAHEVAQEGYAAMLRGDLDAYGGMGFKRRAMQVLVKMLLKRVQLRAVRKSQQGPA
ncbi:MAG: SDR family NAD(P)-dependent oxidoreductase [Pseudomonadales bacterium]